MRTYVDSRSLVGHQAPISTLTLTQSTPCLVVSADVTGDVRVWRTHSRTDEATKSRSIFLVAAFVGVFFYPLLIHVSPWTAPVGFGLSTASRTPVSAEMCLSVSDGRRGIHTVACTSDGGCCAVADARSVRVCVVYLLL